jgi:decaprenylphospho-beta-D-erythro-pentofuranosid-2-ulose 2-reductase
LSNSKNVLILGASSAIAQSVARLYSAKGARLFLVARDSKKLESIKQDLLVRGAQEVNVMALDLCQPEKHTQMVSEAKAKLGSFDIALIAHGLNESQNTIENNYPSQELCFDVNFLSPISLLTELVKHFEAQKHGAIGVITSVAGDRGRRSNYVYGAAKGGLSIYLEGLRYRLQSSNVKVIDIKPGFTDTPMTANMKKGPLFSSSDKVAACIVCAIQKGKSVAYVPGFWRLIMLIIKLMPDFIFSRLKI